MKFLQEIMHFGIACQLAVYLSPWLENTPHKFAEKILEFPEDLFFSSHFWYGKILLEFAIVFWAKIRIEGTLIWNSLSIFDEIFYVKMYNKKLCGLRMTWKSWGEENLSRRFECYEIPAENFLVDSAAKRVC